MAGSITIRPFNPDTPNDKVFNAIRNYASDDFRRRIPASTQADLTETVRMLDRYQPGWNEFVSALINKVGLTIARNRNWTNPLAIFKRGMLEFGNTIEEVQTGLLTAYVYDHDEDYGERALFGRERPEVQSSYHKVNRENFYKITIDTPTLKRAFVSETGLSQFINQLMDAPTTSDNWDEYLLMRQLLGEYEDAGGFFKVHIPAIPEDVDASVQARQALRAVRTYSGKFKFLSRLYNAAHMPVHAEDADLILITTPEFQAAIDVEALAVLFNVSYAEINSRIIIVDEFPRNLRTDGVQAILTTSDFFVVADTLYDTRSVPNPAGLYDNYFLHHWQIVSCSRFVPAIAFTTGAGTVIIEDDTPVTGMAPVEVHDVMGDTVTTVERGVSYEVAGAAITTPTGGVNDAVRFEIIGSLSTHTYITNTAVLHVSADEESTNITIRATSVEDADFVKDVALAVVGDRLILWPKPQAIPDADKDGLGEVVPAAPERTGDTITIPTVTGVQYKNGAANVNNGAEIPVPTTPGVTITAVARANYEVKAGSTMSWTFVKS
jgi:hypothetical protein